MNTISGMLKAIAIVISGLALMASVVGILVSPPYGTWLAVVAVYFVLVSREL